MKVLMLGWELPPFNSGGLGVACEELAKALTNRGIIISFVLPKKVPLKPTNFEILFADEKNNLGTGFYSKFSVYQASSNSRYPLELREVLNSAHNLVDQVFEYAERVNLLVEGKSFDLIHAHDWLSAPAGIRVKRSSRKPLLTHIHATEFDRTGGNLNKQIYATEKYGMNNSDKILAVSKYTKKTITDHYNISDSKVEVVHNGINLENYSHSVWSNSFSEYKKQGYKIVLFVGRITLQKGPDYLIRVAKKVLNYNPKTLFVIAGSGDMQYALIDEVARMNISSKVLFPGFLRGEELNDLYRSADLFVLPSVSEPFGIAPLESVANGTPVLVSKQSGVSEVLSHSLKTDFWDVDEMVDKILGVLNHTSLRSTLKSNSLNEVQSVSWENAAKKCQDIYNSLVN